MNTFSFKCTACEELHREMPSLSALAPLSYYDVPEADRATRCDLGTDDCVIDQMHFFVRGCLEIPVHGEPEPFTWGVWVSLSEASFHEWIKSFEEKKRSHIGPFFGWLNASLEAYPETANLKTRVYLRDHGIRPLIELEHTAHPLAVEQRNGITVERVAELYARVVHGHGA